MFNLLVKHVGWQARQDSIQTDRILEYTDPGLVQRFRANGAIDFAQLVALPTLLLAEVGGQGSQLARFVTLTGAQPAFSGVSLSYVPVEGMPSIPNPQLVALADELSIEPFEFQRTHWAVKNVDLFRSLFQSQLKLNHSPKIFDVSPPNEVEENLVSVMMPFDSRFDDVYQAIRASAQQVGMTCARADDIWENDAIIQDIARLISRSRIVICDCTDRNPNVFYEVGIAHALGRDTILTTQSDGDVPFDLRHLRYIRYLNNGEGRLLLTTKLSERIATLRGAA